MSSTNSTESQGDAGLWLLTVLVGVVAATTIASIVATDGNPAAALMPVGAIAAVYVLVRLPLRYIALALLFLGLVLESPAEILAAGLYKSPIYVVGWLLLAHWNVTIPVKALIFSGLDLALVLIFALAYYRRSTGSRVDGGGFVETPSPMRFFGWWTIFGAFFVELWGAVQGGFDFGNSLWQVEHAAYLPLFFFAFHYAFRGPQDQVAVGKAIIYAATLRATLAWYLRHFFTPNDIDAMPVATTHTDSLLFAGAFGLCVALVLEIPSRKNKLLCLVVLPILFLGMQANNRRIVWVEVALALAVLFLAMPMTRVKRKLVRWTLAALPVVVLYLVVGWNQNGTFFHGAAVVRSVVDPTTDASSQWRENENLDLIVTLKSSPLFGLGYGHKYIGPIEIDDVYAQEHFLPHNSLLGVWAFGGVVGFSLNWMLLAVAAFVACRAYNRARRPVDRVACVWLLQMLMVYMDHCFGDLALGTPTAVLLVGAGMAVVGKLALTTGAWPAKAKTVAIASVPIDGSVPS
jgi:hypothetical protein